MTLFHLYIHALFVRVSSTQTVENELEISNYANLA